MRRSWRSEGREGKLWLDCIAEEKNIFSIEKE